MEAVGGAGDSWSHVGRLYLLPLRARRAMSEQRRSAWRCGRLSAAAARRAHGDGHMQCTAGSLGGRRWDAAARCWAGRGEQLLHDAAVVIAVAVAIAIGAWSHRVRARVRGAQVAGGVGERGLG